MKALGNLWHNEPTVILGIVRQAIALAAAFGLKLTTEQTAALLLFVEAVTVGINRGKVVPVKKVEEQAPEILAKV